MTTMDLSSGSQDSPLGPTAAAAAVAGGTQFLLLGPIQARHERQPVALGRRRERCLLAVLLLEANRAVPARRLMDLLWDGDPPDSARASLHTHVSRLRSRLDPGGGGERGVRLHTREGGYVVETDREAVDAHRFTASVAVARDIADPLVRAATLRRGLAEWRGPALADAGSTLLYQRVAAELDELRLVATELAIEAEQESGRDHQVIEELTGLVADHPLRESLWERLSLALYRSGRQAEALDAITQVRERLADELGLEPGPALQRLQRAILTADPALAPAPGGPAEVSLPSGIRAPRQLPMDIAQFTGREDELGRLEAIAKQAADGGPDGPTATVICAIEGMAGVGKTRLAVHAAHRLVGQGRFDEIQLWADLRGFDAERPPADPAAVLETFIRLLGVPGRHIPDGVEARAALYRDHLAGRRALVLLDNAADEDQVRPLLPGSPSCFVLVTTRHHLSALDGVQPLPLDVFTEREAVNLLSRMAGRERVAAQPEHAARIVELCGHLPIAVTLVGRRLQARPSWAMSDMAVRLAVDDQRLGQLSAGRQTVWTAFDMSYQALSAQQRRLFRRLGLYPGDEITPEAAAALAGTTVREADELLEELLDEHLLQQSTPGRYRMHDLVRLHARDRVQQEEPESQRHAGLGRLVRHYLAGAEQATRLLHPAETRRVSGPATEGGGTQGAPGRTPADAITWTELNLANMVATAYRAAELPSDLARCALRLIIALYRPLANRGHSRERILLNQLAARIARRVGDRHGEAQVLEDLGTIYGQIGLLAESVDHNQQALAIWRAIGDRIGEVGCLAGLGITYRQLKRFDEALACLSEGLRTSNRIGYATGRCSILNHLGLVHQAAGRFDEAIACQRQSADGYRELGNRLGEAIALANLAWAHQRSGDASRAVEGHQQALALFTELGDRYNVAEQLWGLGQAHHLLGDRQRSRAYWRQSIIMLREMGQIDGEQAERMLRAAVPETPEIILLNT